MFRPSPINASGLKLNNILNFNNVITRLEAESLTYAGDKVGGSDIGFMTTLENESYLIKIGVSLSLLGQALKKSVKGKLDTERMYLSFIAGNFIRITSDKFEQHPEIINILKSSYPDFCEKSLFEMLTDQLCIALENFKQTNEGRIILEKLKNGAKNISAAEAYTIYHYIANNNLVAKEVLSLAAYADVLYGAMGQFFNNNFQRYASMPESQLDHHRLLTGIGNTKNIHMASRLIPNAKPFDAFLLHPFKANQREAFLNQAAWLEKCQSDLATSITNLQGLGSAIMVRFLMGESADLGPDNMLLLQENDKQHIVNIDVTGFRYQRRMPFIDNRTGEMKLGWEEVLKNSDPTILLNCLLDKSVFSRRFITSSKDINEEDKAGVIDCIVSTLKDKIATFIPEEISTVINWLQSQNKNEVLRSLESAAYTIYSELHPDVKSQIRYHHKVIEHASTFISSSIQVANDLQNQVKLDANKI